ncbi:hypothetical protein E1200_11415 [Actinomadura sp. GC306]|uniref:hypothetical protein n=1 Tax=Actinomadura sp. GC306 TaxID=2530367 RepID=UPI00104B003E|nr:hypothetical protein [Actinomadura sp. GC306]TDC68533.1 hypothetical protein E1200_11415 [Actinomadura sp. GC306]
MSPHEDAERDRERARAAAEELAELRAGRVGEPLALGNEFSEVRVSLVQTRNGVRLLIEATKSGQWVTLDPLELEALTWQSPATFSAMVGRPFSSLFPAEGDAGPDDTGEDGTGEDDTGQVMS